MFDTNACDGPTTHVFTTGVKLCLCGEVAVTWTGPSDDGWTFRSG